MRKFVFIIFVATVLFSLNLVFYILSEDYRFFVKKIKYSDTVVYDSTEEINDDNTLVVLSGNSLPSRDSEDVFIGQEDIEVSSDSLQFFE